MTKKKTQQREASKGNIAIDVSLKSLRASEVKTRAMRMKTRQESKSTG